MSGLMTLVRVKRAGFRYLQSFRCLVAKSITPRSTVHSRGLRFTLSCDNKITYYRWNNYNTKEPQTLDWVDNQIQGEDVFFDIGANIGAYSIYAALRHAKTRIIAFEPEYANLHLLRDNIFENHLENRIEVYGLALSNRSGLSKLQIQDLTPGAALHTESKEELIETRENQPVIWREGICVYTLDQFCQETHLKPNCVKLDVDGNELEVLEGAMQTLSSKNFRTLIFEFSRKKSIQDRCAHLLICAGLERKRRSEEEQSEIWERR